MLPGPGRRQRDAGVAHAARVRGRALLAVQRAGQDPRAGRLAAAARAAEQVGVVDPAVAQRLSQRFGDVLLADDLGEGRRAVLAVERQRSGGGRAAAAGRVLGGGTGLVACHDVILARTGRDPPHTRQSPLTLAAFRPWGSWRDNAVRGVCRSV